MARQAVNSSFHARIQIDNKFYYNFKWLYKKIISGMCFALKWGNG